MRAASPSPWLQVPPFDDLKIVGDLPELGAWNVAAAPTLLYARDRAFRRLRCLPPDTTATFKVVRVRGDGQLAGPEDFLWEDGPNRVITTGAAGGAMRVSLAFGEGEAVEQSTPEELQVRAAGRPRRMHACVFSLCSCAAVHACALGLGVGMARCSGGAVLTGCAGAVLMPLRAAHPWACWVVLPLRESPMATGGCVGTTANSACQVLHLWCGVAWASAAAVVCHDRLFSSRDVIRA